MSCRLFSSQDLRQRNFRHLGQFENNTHTKKHKDVASSGDFTWQPTVWTWTFQGRPNTVKKAVLITDGPSNRNSYLTLPNAQTLRNAGVEIVAVGVGPNVDSTELQVSFHVPSILIRSLLIVNFRLSWCGRCRTYETQTLLSNLQILSFGASSISWWLNVKWLWFSCRASPVIQTKWWA